MPAGRPRLRPQTSSYSHVALLRRAALRALAAMVLFTTVVGGTIARAAPDSGQSASTLPLPPPSWYTEELHQRILAAGPEGVEVRLSPKRQEETELNCLGTSPPSASPLSPFAVAAGGCMVYPHGCTMNFVFRDRSGANYIGTAGHCVQGGGSVVAQVATRVDPTDTLIVTLANIGKVTKRANSGIGRDFAVVKVDPAFPVVPGVAGAAGPTGVFCGDPVGQPVIHYGHGYIFFVEQGYPKVGEVIPDAELLFRGEWDTGFNWVGYGLPGDSGSGVMNAAGLVVGDLTHGIGVAGVPVPGLNFGTTTAGMFEILGKGFSLVTVDGRTVSCDGELIDVT
jgi:hypothetical protein